MTTPSTLSLAPDGVLRGLRVVSLALNLPGPAALMRLAEMGATCCKVEPPSRDGAPGDPMALYAPAAYAAMHHAVARHVLDLKDDAGRQALYALLQDADVLITSFRPSALRRLGVHPDMLGGRFPRLSLVMIVGEHGAEAEHPGHDLTYEASAGLLGDLALPAAPFADMAGALLVVEAVFRTVLRRLRDADAVIVEEVALADAARFLALPRAWGLMQVTSPIGGGHAGYRVYACRGGRVAVAALEPRLAQALCRATGLPAERATRLHEPAAFGHFEEFFADRSCAEIQALVAAHDLPAVIMADPLP